MRVAGFSTSTRGRSLWRESNGSSTGSERKFLFRMVSGGKIWITGRSFQHSPYPRFDSAVFSTPAASDCAFWHGQIGPVQMTSECRQMLAGLDSRNFAPPIRQILAGTQSGANRARSHTAWAYSYHSSHQIEP